MLANLDEFLRIHSECYQSTCSPAASNRANGLNFPVEVVMDLSTSFVLRTIYTHGRHQYTCIGLDIFQGRSSSGSVPNTRYSKAERYPNFSGRVPAKHFFLGITSRTYLHMPLTHILVYRKENVLDCPNLGRP